MTQREYEEMMRKGSTASSQWYQEQLRKQQQNLPQLAPAKNYALGQSPGNYAEGQRVQDAYSAYQQAVAGKPANYVSPYQGQIDEAYQKILSRQPFKYDMNADALYQQYKDQYVSQGQRAMMDTMGQASAMTGGYGNTYAQTAGQQTNQLYLQQLNDKLPELYDRAYGKYRDEGIDLYNQLSVSQGMDDRSYGKYRDSVSDWQYDVGRLQGDYNYERGFDLDMYRDAVSAFQNQRDYDFQREQFDYQKQRDAEAAAAAAAAAQAAAARRSSGGGKKNNDEEELFKMLLEMEEELKKTQAKNSQYYKALSQGVSMF